MNLLFFLLADDLVADHRHAVACVRLRDHHWVDHHWADHCVPVLIAAHWFVLDFAVDQNFEAAQAPSVAMVFWLVLEPSEELARLHLELAAAFPLKTNYQRVELNHYWDSCHVVVVRVWSTHRDPTFHHGCGQRSLPIQPSPRKRGQGLANSTEWEKSSYLATARIVENHPDPT